MGKNIGSIRKHRKSQNANQSNQDVSNLDKDLEKGEYEDSDEDFEAEPIYRQLERFSATLAPTTAEQNHQGSDQLPPGMSWKTVCSKVEKVNQLCLFQGQEYFQA